MRKNAFIFIAFLLLIASAYGAQVTVTFDAPTTREDGSPLPPEEIEKHTLYLWEADQIVHSIDIPIGTDTLLVEDLENYASGLIGATATATDIYNQESQHSERIDWHLSPITSPTITLSWN